MPKLNTIFYYEELKDLGEDIIGIWLDQGFIKRGKVCGSVRRMVGNPKDLELVIEPTFAPMDGIQKGQLGIFGDNKIARGEPVNLFEYNLQHALDQTNLQLGNLNGPRYKKFLFTFEDARILQIDCFLVLDPASWGMKVFIRTGPGEGFNKPFMTWLRDIRMHVSANRLHSHPKFSDSTKNAGKCPQKDCPLIIPTPTEEDVFKAVGLDYIPPAARCADSLVLAIINRNNRLTREELQRQEEAQHSQNLEDEGRKWV